METLLLHPHTTVRFRALSSSSSSSSSSIKQQPLRLRNLTFSRKEIGAGRPALGSKKQTQPQFVKCSINSNGSSKGGRAPRKNPASGRASKDAKVNQPGSSTGKVDSADQEEIISLFRRIQSSIAKGEPEDSEKKSSDSRWNKPATESVLEIIRSSRKQTTEKASSGGGSKPVSRRRSPPKRGKEVEVEDTQPIPEFRLSRPPSNFMKRSPIPSLSTLRVSDPLSNSEVSPPAVGETAVSQLQKLESMKLPELKELAKSRGVKGYSKLKKKELVELLEN